MATSKSTFQKRQKEMKRQEKAAHEGGAPRTEESWRGLPRTM